MRGDRRGTDADVSADVVVVGAGPAGLTVASELAAAGAEVLVLEAGGLPYDREDRSNLPRAIRDHIRGPQSGARGSGSGEPYFPLRMSRARGIGGSTNTLKSHGLRGRPLDPIDFEPRFDVTWPITYAELEPFIGDAEVYCGMRSAEDPPIDWSPSSLAIGNGSSVILDAAPFLHGQRGQFANLGTALRTGGAIRVVTGATVTGFETDGTGSVTHVEVRSPGRSAFRAGGRHFVIATGGIDNARLLLSSRPVQYLMGPAGAHVGRSFMEHLHYVPAVLFPGSEAAADDIRRICGDADRTDNWIVLSDTTTRAESLLRVAYHATPIHELSAEPAVPAFGDLVRMFPFGPFGIRGRARQAAQAMGGLHHVARAMKARVGGTADQAAFALVVMSEQIPDPYSRITLTGRTDRVGLPLPHLHWRVGRRDFADAQRSTELLAAEVEGLGIGKVVSLWDRGRERPPVVSGGWHHMGTTRMSADPASGVVDANGRVHGIDNLYVAGSSVFATSGYANPTITLVALAVRLGRHLARI